MKTEELISATHRWETNARIVDALLVPLEDIEPRPLPSHEDVRLIALVLPAGTLVLTADWARRAVGAPLSGFFHDLIKIGALDEGHIVRDEAWYFGGPDLNRELTASASKVFALFVSAYHIAMPSHRPFTSLEWGSA